MYSSIPEKYLPDRIVDNVGYFPDGRYQFVIFGQYQIINNVTGKQETANFPLVPADTQSNTIGGARTVRNIVVELDPQADPHAATFFSYSVELVVRRQGLETVSSHAILDAHYDIEGVYEGAPMMGKFRLFYPDELRLNSGDSVVLVVNTRTENPQTPVQVRFPIGASYFIKFN